MTYRNGEVGINADRTLPVPRHRSAMRPPNRRVFAPPRRDAAVISRSKSGRCAEGFEPPLLPPSVTNARSRSLRPVLLTELPSVVIQRRPTPSMKVLPGFVNQPYRPAKKRVPRRPESTPGERLPDARAGNGAQAIPMLEIRGSDLRDIAGEEHLDAGRVEVNAGWRLSGFASSTRLTGSVECDSHARYRGLGLSNSRAGRNYLHRSAISSLDVQRLEPIAGGCSRQ